jgi:hypothetical protein
MSTKISIVERSKIGYQFIRFPGFYSDKDLIPEEYEPARAGGIKANPNWG